MLSMAPAASAGPAGVTPNPESAAASSLNLFELLTYAAPWFAGVIAYWSVASVAVVVTWTFAAAMSVRPAPGGAAPLWRRPTALLGISLAVGVLVAAPWIYGACRVAMAR